MKIPDITPALLARASGGELLALDKLLVSIQPAIYNLAVRMLGNREDAQDACQEILLKITTHLASFRGESSFGTWAYRVASNYLLTARSRSRESPEVSLEAIEEKLGTGLELLNRTGYDGVRALLPEEKLEARRIALGCTQGMLMALDRDQRIAYLLDVVFSLSSDDAASVLNITAQAYRKRLSRARQRLDDFMGSTCSLVSAQAACRCDKQAQAISLASRIQGNTGQQAESPRLEVRLLELATAEKELRDLLRMADAAAVFRGHPEYRAPENMIPAIRAVLTAYEHRLQ